MVDDGKDHLIELAATKVAELEEKLEKADIFGDKMYSQNCALKERIAELEAAKRMRETDAIGVNVAVLDGLRNRIAELEEMLKTKDAHIAELKEVLTAYEEPEGQASPFDCGQDRYCLCPTRTKRIAELEARIAELESVCTVIDEAIAEQDQKGVS